MREERPVSTFGDVDLSSYGTGMGPEYEWLLSDHPLARAERERRASAYFTAEIEHELGLDQVGGWAEEERFAGDLPARGEEVGGLAVRVEPSGDPDQIRHELEDAPVDATVLDARRDYERYRRDHGEPDYVYPGHYIGPDAAGYPAPNLG